MFFSQQLFVNIILLHRQGITPFLKIVVLFIDYVELSGKNIVDNHLQLATSAGCFKPG